MPKTQGLFLGRYTLTLSSVEPTPIFQVWSGVMSKLLGRTMCIRFWDFYDRSVGGFYGCGPALASSSPAISSRRMTVTIAGVQ